jgi:hypothetical protein
MNLPYCDAQPPTVPADTTAVSQEANQDLRRQLVALHEENDHLRRLLAESRTAALLGEVIEVGSNLLHEVLEVICTLLRPHSSSVFSASVFDSARRGSERAFGPLQTSLERPCLIRAVGGQATHLTTRFGSVLWLPIRQGVDVAVVLCLRRGSADPYTHADQAIGDTLAPLVISALQTGYRSFDLKEQHEELATLSGALVACVHTGGGRVAAMARDAERLAERFPMGPEERTAVRLACTLRDIGTVDLAEDLLDREERLSTEALAQVREHPSFGAAIIQQLAGLEAVLPLVLAHHERWDGTGYPQGLAAAAIPLGARIVAVVDAFHNMTNPRSARQPRTVEAAIEELSACSGTQFDCQVVNEFIRLISAQGPLDIHPCRSTTAGDRRQRETVLRIENYLVHTCGLGPDRFPQFAV